MMYVYSQCKQSWVCRLGLLLYIYLLHDIIRVIGKGSRISLNIIIMCLSVLLGEGIGITVGYILLGNGKKENNRYHLTLLISKVQIRATLFQIVYSIIYNYNFK